MLSAIGHCCERTVECLATVTLPGLLSYGPPKQAGTLNPGVGQVYVGCEPQFCFLYTRVIDCFVWYAKESYLYLAFDSFLKKNQLAGDPEPHSITIYNK